MLMSDRSVPLDRLHLGCGLVAPPGWRNIDRSPNVVLDRFPVAKRLLRLLGFLERDHMRHWPDNIERHDVVQGIPAEDGSIAEIYSSHMLEHLYLGEAVEVLRECNRVLVADGVLRLALPDADMIASELSEGVEDGFGSAGERFNDALNAYPRDRPTRRQLWRSLFSANVHRWQPTRSLVSQLLADVGFTDIREFRFREGVLSDIEVLEHREESIFIEARRRTN